MEACRLATGIACFARYLDRDQRAGGIGYGLLSVVGELESGRRGGKGDAYVLARDHHRRNRWFRLAIAHPIAAGGRRHLGLDDGGELAHPRQLGRRLAGGGAAGQPFQ